MKTINYSDGEGLEIIQSSLRRGGILLNLNNVFAVVSTASDFGIEALSKIKKRKEGKSYGSMVSDPFRFIQESQLDSIAKERLSVLANTGALEGSFIRLPWVNNNQKDIVMNGTHQGLILSEPVKTFCEQVEFRLKDEFKDIFMPRLLCSSANISGDQRGSITDRETAIRFGIDREIELFVDFNFDKKEITKGSFPIFSSMHATPDRRPARPPVLSRASMKNSMGYTLPIF